MPERIKYVLRLLPHWFAGPKTALLLGLLCGLTAERTRGQDCSDPLPSHDYSVVGYRGGKEPLPYHQRRATLTFDSGRFTIDHLIRLTDGDILRGAGRDKTVLYFPKGLKDLGEPCGHKGVDCYDWGNGVIRASGKEIGIEDVTIEFPDHEWCHYCGDKNGGYNGVSLSGCTDCWVKNVTIRNCDSGLFVEMKSSNTTVEGVHIFVNPAVRSHLHVAISGFSSNNLVTDFKVYGSTFHGLTGNWGSFSNVFANGWGEALCIEPDHNCNGIGGQDDYSSSIDPLILQADPLVMGSISVKQRTRFKVISFF